MKICQDLCQKWGYISQFVRKNLNKQEGSTLAKAVKTAQICIKSIFYTKFLENMHKPLECNLQLLYNFF